MFHRVGNDEAQWSVADFHSFGDYIRSKNVPCITAEDYYNLTQAPVNVAATAQAVFLRLRRMKNRTCSPELPGGCDGSTRERNTLRTYQTAADGARSTYD